MDGGHVVLWVVGTVLVVLALIVLWEELRLLRHDVLPSADEEADEEHPPAAI